MSVSQRPLILFTNDDGIASPGLWASVEAFAHLGDLLVVAPKEQQSGTGRSMPGYTSGRITAYNPPVEIPDCKAYAVDATPAQTVQFGVLELADRKPSLVVSGINYGENVGNGVTISGTVGAALEAASLGLKALAISVQTPIELHHSYSTDVDFRASAHFARHFGEWLIQNPLQPEDVDLLKIDVPSDATPKTQWRMTRLSRQRIFWPTSPKRKKLSDPGKNGYKLNADPAQSEPDSDVYAVLHDGVVSVTPMSLDMTSRTDMFQLWQIMSGERQFEG